MDYNQLIESHFVFSPTHFILVYIQDLYNFDEKAIKQTYHFHKSYEESFVDHENNP